MIQRNLKGQFIKGYSSPLKRADSFTKKNCIICNKEFESRVIAKQILCSQNCYHEYKKIIPYKKGVGRHNLSNSKIYKSWKGMKGRCLNRNYKGYEHYGGRGITICDKWLNFDGFFEDMSQSYKEGLTLERIDVNGNYFKENCKWIPLKEQANNTRRSIQIDYMGETHNLKYWSNKLGFNYSTIFYRIKKGQDIYQYFNKNSTL